MTDYSYGDIVLVPFPFTDQSAVKKRPAVVVSSDAYNNQRPIIMAVTSQIKSVSYPGETMVNQWQQAGLLKPSLIKPVFTTIDKKLIIKKLGSLENEDRSALEKSLKITLGHG